MRKTLLILSFNLHQVLLIIRKSNTSNYASSQISCHFCQRNHLIACSQCVSYLSTFPIPSFLLLIFYGTQRRFGGHKSDFPAGVLGSIEADHRNYACLNNDFSQVRAANINENFHLDASPPSPSPSTLRPSQNVRDNEIHTHTNTRTRTERQSEREMSVRK